MESAAVPAQSSATPPPSLLQSFIWKTAGMLARLVFRLRVRGGHCIPATGSALLVANGISRWDALFIAAASGRCVKFMAHSGCTFFLLRGWLARRMGVIPIASESSPREWLQSLRAVSDVLRSGDIVCWFAEGELSRIGQLLPFRRDVERILKGLDTVVIPVALDSPVLGGVAPGKQGVIMPSRSWRLRRTVSVNFGDALPQGVSANEARQAVQGLITMAWQNRTADMLPLYRAFVHTARRHPFFTFDRGCLLNVSVRGHA
jgi:acyl-[acyl-carrier-protein]-phospholipid O-acyltransferase/long-chain-fatty-acid--[acyl-carrier-protein] ligase